MNIIKEVFNKNNYSNDFDPIYNYMENTIVTLMQLKNISREDATKIVNIAIDKKVSRDPLVGHWYRPDMEDKNYSEIPMSKYISNAKTENRIIVPSFTTYLNHNAALSPYSGFADNQMKDRSIEKDKMYTALARGDYEMVTYHDVLQAGAKRLNNSLSGAFGSLGKSIYNLSSHSSLTSTIRGVVSIGNGITESIVAGNRVYSTPQIIIEHIMAIIRYFKDKDIRAIIEEYLLIYPNKSDLINIIKRSSSFYFASEEIDNNKTLHTLLDSLTPEQMAAFAYHNDLYHMRVLNPVILRRMLSDISSVGIERSKDLVTDIKKMPSSILNVTYHILADECRGMARDDLSKNDSKLLSLILGTARNVSRKLLRYKDLIGMFFITNVLPPNLTDIRHMARRCVVLSDTDSTCTTYEEWAIDRFGDNLFGKAPLAYISIVMLITTETVDHYLKQFSTNLNIPEEYRGDIRMKNEYTWEVMVPAKNSKHYFALTTIKESIVLADKLSEIKGKRFIAGKSNAHIRDVAHKDMMRILMGEFVSGNKIDIGKYIKIVADIEREIEHSILNNVGPERFLQQERIKNPSDYADTNPINSNYFYHMLWNNVFKIKYGDVDTPYYYGRKFPLITENPSIMKEYFNNNSNNPIVYEMGKFLRLNNKKRLGTIIIDSNKIGEIGIPEEILHIIDINKVIKSNCEVLYLILETLGFFKPSNVPLKDLGY